MKRFIILSALALLFAGARAQFVNQPIGFPGTGFYTFYQRAIDSTAVWVGVDYLLPGYVSYPYALKSTDGGSTWQFHSFPDTGTVSTMDIAALDTSTAYYVIFNGKGNIWKTSNGGSSWVNTTVNQFVGGFANWCHIFSADTIIAGGDPNKGYWEIQISNDAGNSWTRVPSSNIPERLAGEFGIITGYSAIGNNIWFSSNKGRCFFSTDKGLSWSVKQLPGTWVQPLVCFTDKLRGVFWEFLPVVKISPATYNNYYTTVDGGLTWSQRSLPQQYAIKRFIQIPGSEGSMLVSVFDSSNNASASVLYTPDFFNSISVVQTRLNSAGEGNFYNSRHGWLAGDGNHSSSIYKFTGSLPIGVRETDGNQPRLQVFPNPSSAETIVKIPLVMSSDRTMRILDITGKEMELRKIPTSASYLQLDAGRYSNGIYIIQMTSDGGTSAVCRWTVCH